MLFRSEHLVFKNVRDTFTETTAPGWLTCKDTVKGSTMDNSWFWRDCVLTLEVGSSVETDFHRITRIDSLKNSKVEIRHPNGNRELIGMTLFLEVLSTIAKSKFDSEREQQIEAELNHATAAANNQGSDSTQGNDGQGDAPKVDAADQAGAPAAKTPARKTAGKQASQ